MYRVYPRTSYSIIILTRLPLGCGLPLPASCCFPSLKQSTATPPAILCVPVQLSHSFVLPKCLDIALPFTIVQNGYAHIMTVHRNPASIIAFTLSALFLLATYYRFIITPKWSDLGSAGRKPRYIFVDLGANGADSLEVFLQHERTKFKYEFPRPEWANYDQAGRYPCSPQIYIVLISYSEKRSISLKRIQFSTRSSSAPKRNMIRSESRSLYFLQQLSMSRTAHALSF